MSGIDQILDNNRAWVEQTTSDSPDFFGKLAEQHAPELLWIGCSDGRVSPDKLTRLPLGKIFVHRNVGNVFASNDLNCLAVLQYAVDELKVPDIMICGHYDCGGIDRAIHHHGHSPIDLWVDQIRNVYERFDDALAAVDEADLMARCAELNVCAQVHNICRSSIVRDAWARGQKLSVHGVIYSMDNGRLKPISPSVSSVEEWERFDSADVIAAVGR